MDGPGALICKGRGRGGGGGGGGGCDGRSGETAMDGPGVGRPGGLRWTVWEWTVQRTAIDGGLRWTVH